MSSEHRSIIVDGVSKRYRLGEREQYGALRDVLGDVFAGGFRRGTRSRREEIWALRDVSFSVEEGEVVGIIGRNGAGKSTLLKLLSRITTPTEGQIAMRGRIGSLLEVGSGFHPELTGVENVYLNGAILGMKRAEIRSKLDEIVAFAEMDQFMATPVKHYSVGMFMRLAFAVAAHLDSEILVVDEVLAVGDARFQAKCLSKMGEVARSGRSVLFVSHNLDATVALCDRGVVLERGLLEFDGPTRDAVDRYRKLAGVTTRSGDRLDLSEEQRAGTGEARFSSVAVRSTPATEEGSIRTGDQLDLDLVIDSSDDVAVTSLGLTVTTEGGLLLLNLDSADCAHGGSIKLLRGPNEVGMRIPRLHLAPGRYRIGLRLANPVTTRIGSGAVDLLDPAFVLQVDEAEPHGAAAVEEIGAAPSPGAIVQRAGSLVEGSMIISS